MWNNPPVCINNGFLSNEPVLTSVKDQMASGLFNLDFKGTRPVSALESHSVVGFSGIVAFSLSLV